MRHLVIALTLGLAASAAAEPRVSEKTSYYTITGDSFAELRRGLASRGPNGFWAYTSWSIKWSAKCDVDLKIRITFPRLAPNSGLSPENKQIWSAMVDALWRHEQMHAEHGRKAAQEIHEKQCRRASWVIRKWANRDRILDRETDHGAVQGVRLPY